MLSHFTERNLAMQGFDAVDRHIEPWLRLTPSLSTTWIAAGTALQSPVTLLGFSLVSAFGASRPHHPFDRLHRALPENPPPRRFAMALASAWAVVTAVLFASGHRRAGTIAGGLLAAAGATVASTHFCVGSFVYRQLGVLRSRLDERHDRDQVPRTAALGERRIHVRSAR